MKQIQAADAALVVCMWRPISLVFNWIIWIPRCTSDTWADRRCARHLVEATCRCGPYTCCRGNRSKQSRRIRRPQRASDSNMCRRLVIKNIIYLSRVWCRAGDAAWSLSFNDGSSVALRWLAGWRCYSGVKDVSSITVFVNRFKGDLEWEHVFHPGFVELQQSCALSKMYSRSSNTIILSILIWS